MPLVIAGVTHASNKWGHTIAGIISSLPWVAGPIILFIAIEQGAIFAANSISGVMIGIIGWLSFCLTYIWVGRTKHALTSGLAAYGAYIFTALLLQYVAPYLSLNAWFIFTLFLITTCIYFYPTGKERDKNEGKPLKYDLPLRMIATTTFVITITYFAKNMGPLWSGILTPIPVVTSVLGMFSHYTQGIDSTRTIFKGMMIGIYGFTAFLFLQAHLLPITSIGISFIAGLMAQIFITASVNYGMMRSRL
jgi:hypothetical protein